MSLVNCLFGRARATIVLPLLVSMHTTGLQIAFTERNAFIIHLDPTPTFSVALADTVARIALQPQNNPITSIV